MKAAKEPTHVVLIRHHVEDDFPRWELISFAPSQKAADAIARQPIDRDGDAVDVRLGDLIVTGKMEIVQPEVMQREAKLFVAIDKAVRLSSRSMSIIGPSVEEAPNVSDCLYSLTLKKKSREKRTWLEAWEGDEADAYTMACYCDDVPWRRITSAACAVAMSVLGNIDRDDVRSLAESYVSFALKRRERTPQSESEKLVARKLVAECVKIFTPKDVFAASAATAAASTSLSHRDARADLCDAIDNAARSMGSPYVASPLGNANELKQLANIVREHIPLSALMCSMLGAGDPSGVARENPRRRR